MGKRRNGCLPPEKVARSGLYRLNLDKVMTSMVSCLVFLGLYAIAFYQSPEVQVHYEFNRDGQGTNV